MSKYPPSAVAILVMEEAQKICEAAELDNRECLETLLLLLAAFFLGNTHNTLAEAKEILNSLLSHALERLHAEKIRQLNEL